MEQNQALKIALVQMIELGKAFLQDRRRPHSKIYKLPNGVERSYDDRRAIEDLRYNEIAAAANVINLFTGREFSFQWQLDDKRNQFAGFALYEILEGCPCDHILPGVSYTAYSRYTGKRVYDRRINWGKSRDEGKIVKIFEHIIDYSKNPAHSDKWLVEEFKAPVLTSTAFWSYTYNHSDPLYGIDLYRSGTFNTEEERIAWCAEAKEICEKKGFMEPLFVNNDF